MFAPFGYVDVADGTRAVGRPGLPPGLRRTPHYAHPMSASPYAEDFPPDRHVSRDLGVNYRLTSRTSSEVRLPVTEHLLHDDRSVRSDVLLTVFDEAAGFLAIFSVLPDWLATADMTIGVDPRPVGDEVVFETRILKAGKRLVVVEAEASISGERTAWAATAFSRVPRSARNADFEIPEPDPDTVHHMAVAGSGLDRSYPDALGIRTLDATHGVVELEGDDYTRNSAGLLHGGVGGTICLAAVEALASSAGGRWRTIDAHFHYLSPGRVGPFRTSAHTLARHAERSVSRVELVDAGDDDRVMTVATITTTPLG